MKKNSAFQIALLATFGALAIAGVLIFSFFISKGDNASIGAVTVWGTFDEALVQGAFADLAETHPDLESVTYIKKNQATYQTDLVNAFASGEAPDLFFLTQEEAYAQKGRVILIPDTVVSGTQYSNTFIDGSLPFVDTDGTVGLPVVADPLVMYWNKDLLAAGGFSRPPEYWDELLELAQRLTRKSDTGTLLSSAIAFGAYGNVDHAKELITMLILQAGGSITERDTVGRLSSGLLAQNRSATQVAATPSAIRFFTEFADPSKTDYTWNRSFPTSQRAFTSGVLALYFGHASEIAALKEANPNLNFAMAPMPQIRGAGTSTGGVVATGGTVYGVAIPKAAKNPGGARVIQWLLASKDVSAALSTSLGMPSARRDVLNTVLQQQSDQLAPSDTLIVATGAATIRSWSDPDPAKTDGIFRAMIEDTTSGTILLSEAIMRADQQIDNLVGI